MRNQKEEKQEKYEDETTFFDLNELKSEDKKRKKEKSLFARLKDKFTKKNN